jgi:hypothetical protein
MDIVNLEKIAGDFHLRHGVKEVKDKKTKSGVLQIYHAYEFYRQCENVEGMKRCRDYLGKTRLGVTISDLGRLIAKNGGGDFKYAKEFIDRLTRDYSGKIKEGRIDEAFCDCFIDMGQ